MTTTDRPPIPRTPPPRPMPASYRDSTLVEALEVAHETAAAALAAGRRARRALRRLHELEPTLAARSPFTAAIVALEDVERRATALAGGASRAAADLGVASDEADL